MNSHIPRIVIAGTHSGVGKTTIVTGLLRALREQRYRVQPFKVGPDYIDPGFHTLAAGRNSYNLDTWLIPEEQLPGNFCELAKDCDIAVIEGVMGLYDGGAQGVSSTAAIAKQLQAPVVLVLNVKSMGQSAGALALGYRDYDPDLHVAGVILNCVGSERHAAMTREAIEELGIPVLGIVHRNEFLQTPERHLGLTPTTEIDSETIIQAMGEAMNEALDTRSLMQVAEGAPDLHVPSQVQSQATEKVRIGIARDEAFSFYYPTGLAYLEKMGVELVPFSPLQDKKLPDVQGLIFGGGFPEMFLTDLSANEELLQELRQAATEGMPIYAECGGLMYLCRQIVDFEGKAYSMVGIVPAITEMQQKLQRVGYVTATLKKDSLFGACGDQLRGHEFHFSTMRPDDEENFPWAYELQGTRQKQSHREGYAKDNILASYLHLAFEGNPKAMQHFLAQCRRFTKGAKK